jgi:hypothetical protein
VFGDAFRINPVHAFKLIGGALLARRLISNRWQLTHAGELKFSGKILHLSAGVRRCELQSEGWGRGLTKGSAPGGEQVDQAAPRRDVLMIEDRCRRSSYHPRFTRSRGQSDDGAAMTLWDAFFLGMMVAWTPSLVLVLLLLRDVPLLPEEQV